MLTQERLQQIARKLRTYIEIYPGDKEARAMADDCERAAAVGAEGERLLRMALDTFEEIRKAYLGKDAEWAEWSYVANTIRCIEAALTVGANVGTDETTTEKSA